MEKRLLNDAIVDLLTLLGFVIGLENLEMNTSQSDLQEQTARLDKKVDEKVDKALAEIHEHLEMQDRKLRYIIEVLKNENH